MGHRMRGVQAQAARPIRSELHRAIQFSESGTLPLHGRQTLLTPIHHFSGQHRQPRSPRTVAAAYTKKTISQRAADRATANTIQPRAAARSRRATAMAIATNGATSTTWPQQTIGVRSTGI